MSKVTKIQADNICEEFEYEGALDDLIDPSSNDSVEACIFRTPAHFVDPRFLLGLKAFNAQPNIHRYDQMKKFISSVDEALAAVRDPDKWTDDERHNLTLHTNMALSSMTYRLQVGYVGYGPFAPDPDDEPEEFDEYIENCKEGISLEAVADTFADFGVRMSREVCMSMRGSSAVRLSLRCWVGCRPH